jgi:hypothetical protein
LGFVDQLRAIREKQPLNTGQRPFVDRLPLGNADAERLRQLVV